VAGTGQPGFLDGKAASAQFNGPTGIAVNTKDEVFVCEVYNHRIRKVSCQLWLSKSRDIH